MQVNSEQKTQQQTNAHAIMAILICFQLHLHQLAKLANQLV